MEINGDVENGENKGFEDMREPFIPQKKVVAHEEDESDESSNRGTMGMVLLSTFVAVCGSFEFGSCVSTKLYYLVKSS